GAQWISSPVIGRIVNEALELSKAVLAYQWVIDPDGDPATVFDVPHVCSNSWASSDAEGTPPCDPLLWSFLDALEAAGTLVVFSAGNQGSAGLERPPDRATDDYRTFAVAAVNGNSPPSYPVASFSSKGPSFCTPDGSPAIKPDIAAPGVNVLSSVINGQYG